MKIYILECDTGIQGTIAACLTLEKAKTLAKEHATKNRIAYGSWEERRDGILYLNHGYTIQQCDTDTLIWDRYAERIS